MFIFLLIFFSIIGAVFYSIERSVKKDRVEFLAREKTWNDEQAKAPKYHLEVTTKTEVITTKTYEASDYNVYFRQTSYDKAHRRATYIMEHGFACEEIYIPACNLISIKVVESV